MASHTKTDSASVGKIPITRPMFDEREASAVEGVLRSGWVVQGPQVACFEQMMAEFTGARHAIATTSCTTALHLALSALGIGAGDEVLLPSFTFVATANAVVYTGARPVFVDVDLETFNLSPAALEKTLSRCQAARGVMPVSLFGLCADMEAINGIAVEHDLVIVEDAACSLGARRDGHHAGTEAKCGCFSFHPRKAITTGEGGMVITDDAQLAERMRMMRDHGASKTDLARHLSEGGSLLPDFDLLGYNYRMTDIQGAVGVVQMTKAPAIIGARRAAAERYDQMLDEMTFLQYPVVPEGFVHAYQSYVCLYTGDQSLTEWPESLSEETLTRLNRERNRLMAYMESQGVAVRQGTHAVHTLGYYRTTYGISPFDYPNSYIADRLSITLPLYAGITSDVQQRVVECLNQGYIGTR